MLFEQLKAVGLPVETGTGGLTKFNRTRLGLPKHHWTDAVAVGVSTPEQIIVKVTKPLSIKATGYGHRRMSNINKFGFPQINKKLATRGVPIAFPGIRNNPSVNQDQLSLTCLPVGKLD